MKYLKSLAVWGMLLTGCTSDNATPEAASLPPLTTHCTDEKFDNQSFTMEARTFTVRTPCGWALYQDNGIDTYVGRIAGPRDTIYFDQGYLSFGSLDNISKNENTIFFRKLSIDHVPAIIHKEYRDDDSDGYIRLSVYIDAGDKQRLNRLYVFDPQDEDLILAIFQSHQFK